MRKQQLIQRTHSVTPRAIARVSSSTLWLRYSVPALIAVVAVFLFAGNARAEYRCDCTQVVAECSASASLNGSQVNLESSNRGCSRIDYLVDGQPFTALIVGGADSLPWPGQPLRDPQVIVENCRVCSEAGSQSNAQPDAVGDEPVTERELQPLVKVLPDYPRAALINNLEGDVLVEFSVNQQGGVQNIRVIQTSNQVFELATLDAVSRFRFTPAMKNGNAIVSAGIRERFSFRLSNNGTVSNVSSSVP